MNFRIVEQVDPDYDVDDVLADYLSGMLVRDIRAKYGISTGSWNTLMKHFREDGIQLRSKRKPRYYTHNRKGDYYIVQRTFNGRYYSFGTFKSEEDAKARVEELDGNGWDGLL